MLKTPVRTCTTVALLLAVGPAMAEGDAAWRVGEVSFGYSPAAREFTASCAGRSLQP